MSDTVTTVTPYQAARVMNVILEEHGLSPIRPQMIYNYVRKGTITSIDGKVDLTDTSDKGFTAWARKYIEKKMSQGTEATVTELRSLVNL